jgi:hypothetical protein
MQNSRHFMTSPISPAGRFRLHGILWLVLISMLALGQRESLASVTATTHVDEHLFSALDVELVCGKGNVANQTSTITGVGRVTLKEGDFEAASINCRVKAIPPAGYSVSYETRGDSSSLVDRNGCLFARITQGQSNDCEISLTQEPVRLTVYKKWVGASGQEQDVQISLECESGEFSGYRYINEGSPNGWEIRDIDPEGILCNVSETVRDNFNPDIIDCQGLYILPGKGEECTLVNTKIVKRIEMLNRYGKLIMIFLVLVVGLVAMKRLN